MIGMVKEMVEKAALRKAYHRACAGYTAFENYLIEQLTEKGVGVSKDVAMADA
jgi:hypothetical protein